MNCSPNNCVVHLHSAAGKDWFLRRLYPFRRHVSPDGTRYYVMTQADNKQKLLTPAQVSTVHFKEKKADMESNTGCRVDNILFILPASSNSPQYQSQVSDAAAAAGAHVLLFIERPVLAAAYYNSLSPEPKTVLVFELDGRILEISLINVDLDLIVKAAVSDLGCPLFHVLLTELSSKLEFDFTSDVKALIDIRMKCERAKNVLCMGSDSVELKFERQGREVIGTLSRGSLVEMNLNLLRSGIMRCLMDARVEKEAVDEVVLAGASTNIPEVRQVLREFFHWQPFRCETDPANVIQLSALEYVRILSDLTDLRVVGIHIADLGVFSV
ncbi:ribosome-associated molecular chaperone SSB1-like [Dendrobium catenatum]|nr:ribosome-associated molecular chaperone SSB1-like [Dendrobium catenatum]